MATINVTVLDRDTNLGIPNGVIVLYNKGTNTQTTLTTNASGIASFTNVPIGNYSVYNTYIAANATPPTVCGFPSGYTGTTYARRLDVAVTTAGQTSAINFNFDKPVPWSTLNGGNPPNDGIALNRFVNLATGQLTQLLPNIASNGIGYCLADNMIYGNGGRSDTTTTVALNYPITYTTSYAVGDCDADGHHYSTTVTNNSFLCIDVDPRRTTYLRAVNPYNGFQEITSSPYTVSYTDAPSPFASADWSYVPSVSGIVGVARTTLMWILSLTTPNAYNVPITGISAASSGLSFADSSNFYFPSGGRILKYAMTTTSAIGTVLSTTALGTSGDATRAVNQPVFYAQPITTKIASKNYGTQGDTLTFTTTIVNTGVTEGLNSILNDTVPEGLSFIGDSVTLNGVQQVGITPDSIPLGTLPIGEVFTVTFSTLITTNTLPSISNIASVNTSFLDQATNSNFSTTYNSNTTLTTLANATLSLTKTVNKSFAIIGETLSYSIILQNTGSSTVTNVTVLDTTPNGTAFITNSLKLNGTTVPGGTLYPTGFNVGTLASGAVQTITFDLSVVSIPSTNPIPNSALVSGLFTIDSTTTPNRIGTTSTNSNIVDTQINYVDLSGPTKSVDKVYATVGDILSYTIAMTNTGNVDLLNVLLRDTIPNGTSFVADSIYLNGVNVPGTTVAPPTGFDIGTIPVNETTTVTFKLLVTTIPTPNPIINNSTINYDYILIPSTGQISSGGSNTNSTSTQVNFANIMYPTKTVDKAYTNIPATVTYTIAMKNLGNTTALNLVFSDTIPTGTTFVANSVTLNGVTQSGAVVAPPGFTLGTLAAGAIATVTFQVNVTTIPNPNTILNSGTTNYSYVIDPSIPTTGTGGGNTNTVSTQVKSANLIGFTKLVDKSYATCGDIINYTIIVPNSGNTTALNVMLVDTIPNGTIFMNNSLYINGIQQVGSNPTTGVTIPNIGPGATATLTFSVQIQC